MKRIRLLGLALIALIALGAFASASAFAGNPEILPKPTAGEPAAFTSEAGETILLTTKKVEVKCKKAKNKGEFTTQDSGLVLITFEECKLGAGSCNSPGDAKGIILTLGLLDIVAIKPSTTLELGVYIEPKEEGVERHEKMLEFKCGVATVLILGEVIGVVDNKNGTPLKDLEKLQKEVKVLWKEGATQGEQQIKTCELLEVLCKGKVFELQAEFGAGHELAAETAIATLKFTNEYEVHF